jgi:hypothetical protein
MTSDSKYSAHFAKTKAQSSVGPRYHDLHENISATYVLKRREVAISFQAFPAYFGSSKTAQSSVGPRDGFGFFQPRDRAIRSDNVQHILQA